MHSCYGCPVGDQLSEAMGEKGHYLFSWYDGGARSFTTQAKPIQTASGYDKARSFES